mgnify:CR=1 FL=1
MFVKLQYTKLYCVWSLSTLALCYFGTSVLWYFGALVFWYFGALVLWCFGTLVLWYFGALVLWCFGTLVLWYFGTLVLWYFGTLVLWYFGGVSVSFTSVCWDHVTLVWQENRTTLDNNERIINPHKPFARVLCAECGRSVSISCY